MESTSTPSQSAKCTKDYSPYSYSSNTDICGDKILENEHIENVRNDISEKTNNDISLQEPLLPFSDNKGKGVSQENLSSNHSNASDDMDDLVMWDDDCDAALANAMRKLSIDENNERKFTRQQHISRGSKFFPQPSTRHMTSTPGVKPDTRGRHLSSGWADWKWNISDVNKSTGWF